MEQKNKKMNRSGSQPQTRIKNDPEKLRTTFGDKKLKKGNN